ncbi:MAG: urease accessory protein UreE [Gammaproteobacteria bacterium]|nr:urease accessory protein UreE [Gammaproteobacteria bacterium]MCP5137391.1 urease accessory protein UreE [Gammaproteobacteria bacterium]
MLELTEKLTDGEAETTLTLPLDQRVKSRLRVTLDDGRRAGVFLPRGAVLRDGDLLKGEGLVVRVKAAAESVSTVRCDDALTLARAAYHLGNRHVALQIEPGLLRYQHDHVLDEMLCGLGLEPKVEQAPFQPEPGAYGGHGHGGHGHDDHHHEHDDH